MEEPELLRWEGSVGFIHAEARTERWREGEDSEEERGLSSGERECWLAGGGGERLESLRALGLMVSLSGLESSRGE